MRRGRDLQLLVGSVGVSALGDWLALVPLALYLEERTGSGLWLAALFIAIWCPVIVLAAPAGLLVDRYDPRRLLAVVSLAQAVVAVALAFNSSPAAIVALAALIGSGFALAQPAEFSLVPAVASGRDLTKANGWVETSRYVGFTAGPLLGGALAAAGGMKVALLANAATFVGVAAAAVLIRARRERAPHVEGTIDRARDGIVFLFRDRLLALVMTVAFASLLLMTASATAEVFFAKDDLGVGDFGFGALLASWTFGMAFGALVLARRFRLALAGGALVAIVVQSVGLGAPTLWLTAAFCFVMWFVGGSAHGLKNVLIRTLIHERVPERLHGRAFAAYNGLRNFAEIFALAAGGVLVAAIGARWTLFLAGLIPAAAGLAGLAVYARRRAADTETVPAPTTP